jgi:large subunit ribosomal protein L21
MVTGEVVEQTRGKKIIVFKKKRRKNHRRRNGHRQDLTSVRITEILTDGKKPAKAKAKAAPQKAKAAAKDQGAKKADDAPKAEAGKDETPAAEE